MLAVYICRRAVNDKRLSPNSATSATAERLIISEVFQNERKSKKQPENRRKFYLMEFSYFDGEYDVTFNIVDIDFLRRTITVAISRCGKITQDTFDLLRDRNGNLYFEYGRFYENKISIDDFEEVL